MKIIDLSHKINEDAPVYPGDLKFELNKTKNIDEDQYVIFDMKTNMHVGTHVDVKMHLIDDDEYISQYDIERFIGKAVVLDVSDYNENTIKWHEKYDEQLTSDDIVILHTGWYKHYNARYYYAKHPKLTLEFAKKLIGKGIKLLAIDMPSPDYEPFLVHKELLKNDILIVENLANVHELLGKKNICFYGVPLKINAEASMIRAYAVLGGENE